MMVVYLQVLSGDIQAAEVLAVEVHRDLSVEEINMDNLPQFTLPLEQCGMWIDPIGMTHILHSALYHVSNSVGLITELSLFICISELFQFILCTLTFWHQSLTFNSNKSPT
jgi:hypothetical protein